MELLGRIRGRVPDCRHLCVGGGLFFNSALNTRVKLESGFQEVYVPINPGDAGLAVGCAMYAAGSIRCPVSPFAGPNYSSEEVKATLDNCKLTYDWASEADTIGAAIHALQKGRTVAWFEGGMEWGARALGARSLLASPFSPYVLDNLNRFLKQREGWRGYALTGLADAVRDQFHGPAASPYMECDYLPRDVDRFSRILPGRALRCAYRR